MPNKKFIFNSFIFLLIIANILHRVFLNELRLDEYGSLWVIQDSWGNIFQRWQAGHGQSALFSIFIWIVRNFIAESIYVLRLFSFVLFLGSAYVFFKIAEIIYNRELAFFSCLLFLSFYEVTYFSSEIRPYPLAMFFFLLATYLITKWTIDQNLIKLFVYPFALAGMLYTQPLFVQILPLHLLIIFLAGKKNFSKNYLIKVIIPYVFLLILLLPLQKHLISLGANSKFLATGIEIDSWDFFNSISLIFGEIVFLFFILICFKWTIYNDKIKFKINNITITKEDFIVISWFAIPFLFNAIYSLITGFSIFLPRYFSPYLPAKALLLSTIIEKLVFDKKTRSAIQRVFLTICIIVTGIVIWKYNFIDNEWKKAVKIIAEYNKQEKCPIIFHSGYIEHENITWLKDPAVSSFISYPYQYYNLENEFKLLPGICKTQEVESYYQQELLPFIQSAKNCVWLGNFGNPLLKECSYFKDILKDSLFINSVEYKVGNQGLILYTKNN